MLLPTTGQAWKTLTSRDEGSMATGQHKWATFLLAFPGLYAQATPWVHMQLRQRCIQQVLGDTEARVSCLPPLREGIKTINKASGDSPFKRGAADLPLPHHQWWLLGSEDSHSNTMLAG